jgi:UDP-N-acetylmuramyl pentapeptide phosphotransferase/UDP-N-acetylglucosamine-1-phosphate transferase
MKGKSWRTVATCLLINPQTLTLLNTSIAWMPFSLLLLAVTGAILTALVHALRRRVRTPASGLFPVLPEPEIVRGGGLAIVFGLSGLALLWLLRNPGDEAARGTLWVWLIGGGFLAFFSFLDDVRPVSRSVRLVLQTLTALIFLSAVFGWPTLELPGLPEIRWGWLGWALLLLWILGVTNIYSSMDNVGNLASVQAVVAGLGWAFVGSWAGDPVIFLLGSSLAGLALGFLAYNRWARPIAMGDAGSAYIGFFLAALPLIAFPRQPQLANPTIWIACGALLVWPFLFDGIYTRILRLRDRSVPGGCETPHLYERLVAGGLPPSSLSVLYGTFALAGWPLAALWLLGVEEALWLSLPILALLSAMLLLFARYRERPDQSKAKSDEAVF